jgi:signal transduction histidine kinase
MINDLLDLSCIEAGRMDLRLTTVQPSDVVGDVIDTLHPLAQIKDVHLYANQVGKLTEMQADRDKLHQILTNLIQNGLKFTPQGGEIRAETQLVDDRVVQFCVSDTGCGISLQELPKVFERFYRGQAVKPEQQGAGLGLAITKSLVELHGGRIWAESIVGQGTQVFFTIPVHRARQSD